MKYKIIEIKDKRNGETLFYVKRRNPFLVFLKFFFRKLDEYSYLVDSRDEYMTYSTLVDAKHFIDCKENGRYEAISETQYDGSE